MSDKSTCNGCGELVWFIGYFPPGERYCIDCGCALIMIRGHKPAFDETPYSLEAGYNDEERGGAFGSIVLECALRISKMDIEWSEDEMWTRNLTPHDIYIRQGSFGYARSAR